MFIGETYFENSNIANLNNIDVERKQLVCEICSPQSLSKNIDSYPCIQCDAGDCMRSFHVTCAQQKGFSRMIVDDNNGQLVGKTYCPTISIILINLLKMFEIKIFIMIIEREKNQTITILGKNVTNGRHRSCER